MKQIALLKQSAGRGGLEKQTLGIARSLALRGCQVDLLTAAPWSQLPGINCHRIARKQRWSYSSLLEYERATQRWLQEHSYERVLGLEQHSLHTHYRAGSGVHQHFLQLRSRSWWQQLAWRLSPFHHLILKLQALTFGPGGARRIYANSHAVAAQIEEYYGTDPKRICVIHNGVAWQELAAPFEHSLTHYPSKELRYLLFIGHGYARKGLQIVLKALAASKSGFHLLVAGRERHLLGYQQLAHQLGLSSRVQWLGAVEQTTPLYAMSEALLLPTLYDPFANVTLEALAMGLYVVTSVQDGAGEVLSSYSGQTLEIGSIDPWVAAIEQLWKKPHSPDSRRIIRDSVQHLEWEWQLARLIDDLLTH